MSLGRIHRSIYFTQLFLLIAAAPMLAANEQPFDTCSRASRSSWYSVSCFTKCHGFAASPTLLRSKTDLDSKPHILLPGPRALGHVAAQERISQRGCSNNTPRATLVVPNIRHFNKNTATRVGLCGGQLAGSGEGLETADVIYCGMERVPFLRSAFGMYDDVTAEVWRADPICADRELINAKELRGRIALVQRGSSESEPCSFVDKAHRVEEAGAVGCIIFNTEDSLVAPGDSAREGTDVSMPVVGIRASDTQRLPDGEEATLSFQPIAALTSEQRKHLRAVAMIKEAQQELAQFSLEQDTTSEAILSGIDQLLSEHELVSVRFGDSTASSVTLSDLEDVIDVSTVLADNLRATVIQGGAPIDAVLQIKANVIILHRSNPKAPKILLPEEGEAEGLLLSMLDGVDVRALDPISRDLSVEPFQGPV